MSRARGAAGDGHEPGRNDATTALARALVDEWARAGISRAYASPGSRSTPLILALAREARVGLDMVLDERSAAFRALGAAKASGRPSVVLCTSGTAAANLHPAVVEAHHARVPLVVCTADRPPELRDTGAGQVIDQVHIYGRAVRWQVQLGPPDDHPGAVASWRPLAARAVAEAVGPPAGPVHVNLSFREPLVASGAALVPCPGRPDGRPWTSVAPGSDGARPEEVDALVEMALAHGNGVVVAGWGPALAPERSDRLERAVERFSLASGWPLLADPISGARRGATAVSCYDALLRAPGFAAGMTPEIVLQVGASLTSKVATAWLGSARRHVLVDPDGAWLDPGRTVSERLVVDPGAALDAATGRLDPRGPSEWSTSWRRAEATARRTIDGLMDGWSRPFEGRVARDVAASLPDGSTLVVASSMPVRDLESFSAARRGLRVLANRGANGIDGFVSTTLGVSDASGGPVVALCGDLCFLHDAGGLLGAAGRAEGAVFVVVDNEGGGIFSFLDQASLPAFEELFATPQQMGAADLARAHGLPVAIVEEGAQVAPAIEELRKAGGVSVVVVPSERSDNLERHREIWAAVADALGPSSRDRRAAPA